MPTEGTIQNFTLSPALLSGMSGLLFMPGQFAQWTSIYLVTNALRSSVKFSMLGGSSERNAYSTALRFPHRW